MLKEFRDFITKGNVIDLAIGIVIGAAFGTVVTSFVDDILMPIIGLFTGGADFTNLFIPLDGNSYATLAEAQEAGAATLNYGLFINALISFLIISLALFLVIRQVNKVRGREEEVPAEPPAPTAEELLLTEIRDLLAVKPND